VALLLALLAVGAAGRAEAVGRSVHGPRAGDAASPRLFYRAAVDLDGRGAGQVRLRALHPGAALEPSGGRIEATLASGRRVSLTTSTDAPFLPGLVAVGSVAGGAREELFVDVGHITTFEHIAVYAYWHGALVLAGGFAAFGEEYGFLWGITCSVHDGAHLITQHSFQLATAGRRRWMERNTVYRWAGARLELAARGSAHPTAGAPPAAQAGVACGHTPSA